MSLAPLLSQSGITTVPKLEEPSRFGHEIRCVGDRDRDGVEDLAVSAPRAWGDHGRTGCVLIVSAANGKILRTLQGEVGDSGFGEAIFPIRLTKHSIVTHLAVTFSRSHEPKGTWTRVFSLDDGRATASIPRAGRILGCPGDLDSDRALDYMMDMGWTSRWFSGADWKPLAAPTLEGTIHMLDEDYDGDGLLDYVAEPSRGEDVLRVCSSRTQKPLATLKLRSKEAVVHYQTAVCTGLTADGKRTIVVCNPDAERGIAGFTAFSGVTGQSVVEATFGRWLPADHDWMDFQLFPAPDLDGDGLDDFLAARTPFLGEEVRAYSSRSLDVLWRTRGVVEPSTPSMTMLRRRAGARDGTGPLLAVGRVLHLPDGPEDGYGAVILIDPRTGLVLRDLEEREYLHFGRPLGAPSSGRK